MEVRRLLNSKRKANNRKKLIILSLVIGLLVVITLLLWFLPPVALDSKPSSVVLGSSSPSLPDYFQEIDFAELLAQQPRRPLFPYSIIPRGVASAEELSAALRYDSVAASHYSGFRVASARITRNPRDRQVFVSYRLGNQIYWTKKKMTLRAGESLLSDGTHLARTRCGNRISELPAAPTSPSEPPNQVLNTPLGPRLPQVSPDPLPNIPAWEENPIPPQLLSLGADPSVPTSGPGGGYVSPTVPILCCGGPSKPPGTPPVILPPGLPGQPGLPPAPPPTTPTVPTPEPGVLVLLSAGLASLLLFQVLRRT